jgi:hypothetical protein
MLRIAALALALAAAFALNAEAATKAIKFGKLWDGHRSIANTALFPPVPKPSISPATPEFPA